MEHKYSIHFPDLLHSLFDISSRVGAYQNLQPKEYCFPACKSNLLNLKIKKTAGLPFHKRNCSVMQGAALQGAAKTDATNFLTILSEKRKKGAAQTDYIQNSQ